MPLKELFTVCWEGGPSLKHTITAQRPKRCWEVSAVNLTEGKLKPLTQPLLAAKRRLTAFLTDAERQADPQSFAPRLACFLKDKGIAAEYDEVAGRLTLTSEFEPWYVLVAGLNEIASAVRTA